jgi:hypothetical protein
MQAAYLRQATQMPGAACSVLRAWQRAAHVGRGDVYIYMDNRPRLRAIVTAVPVTVQRM